jgi:hypothetical protein
MAPLPIRRRLRSVSSLRAINFSVIRKAPPLFLLAEPRRVKTTFHANPCAANSAYLCGFAEYAGTIE